MDCNWIVLSILFHKNHEESGILPYFQTNKLACYLTGPPQHWQKTHDYRSKKKVFMSQGIVSSMSFMETPLLYASQSHGGDTGGPRFIQQTQQICIWNKNDKVYKSLRFYNELWKPVQAFPRGRHYVYYSREEIQLPSAVVGDTVSFKANVVWNKVYQYFSQLWKKRGVWWRIFSQHCFSFCRPQSYVLSKNDTITITSYW